MPYFNIGGPGQLEKKLILWATVLLLIIGLPALSFLYFPNNLLEDDSAICLRYVDNIASGNGYRYNPSDKGPVFGSSSIAFTYIAALLKKTELFNDSFLYMRLPGLFGYAVVLFTFFLTGYRTGGYLLGFLGLGYVALFPNSFYYANSGLETLMAGAIFILMLYLFYFRKSSAFVFVLSASLVIVKLDLWFASLLIMTAQLYFNFKCSGNKLADCVIKPATLYVVPLLLFLIYCWIYFGSPIPNSLMAKLLFIRSSEFNYFHSFFQITHPTAFLSLVSFMPLALLFTSICFRRVLPSAQFMVIFCVASGLLLQLWITPFSEVFAWYFIVPFLAFQFMVLCSINEYNILHGQSNSLMSAIPIVPVIVIAAAGLLAQLFPALQTFQKAIQYRKSNLIDVESERRSLGQFLKKVGSPEKVLLASHGWTAYESGMRVIDRTGINTPEVLAFRGQDSLSAIIKNYSPDFIVDHKKALPILVSNYDLIKTGFNIFNFNNQRNVYVPEMEVYKKKKKPVEYVNIHFLDFAKSVQSYLQEEEIPTIEKAGETDYIIRPNLPGIVKNYIEFRGLYFDNATIGGYLYVDEASPLIDFIIEIKVGKQEAIRKSFLVGPAQGIVSIAINVQGQHEGSAIRIFTQIHNNEGKSEALPHVRDLYIAKRL